MRADFREQPREFVPLEGINLKDMGSIFLEHNEQVTFTTASNKNNDIVRTEWGFYLGNSINWRLREQGFKTALVVSRAGNEPRLYINLVEQERMNDFFDYLKHYHSELVCWLDEWFLTHQ
ncbi:MAG: hypothetical protein AB1805_03305 [Nitrospirota bacterium]